MANVDETTPGFNLPVPSFENNTQDYDVPRIAAALYLIDAALSSLTASLNGKAPSSHQHLIEQVQGLAEALAAKMPSTWRPALDELSDVDVSAGANGQFLKKVGSLWISAGLQLGDVTGWQDTVVALINSAIANLIGGSPAALDTLNELAAALGNDPNFAATVSASLGNRLRVDAAQILSAGQKAQALGNLGVSPLMRDLLDDTTQDAALTTLGVGAGLRALRAMTAAAEIFAALKQEATTTETGVVRKATAADVIAGTADRYPDAAVLKPALVAAGPAAMVNFNGGNPPTIRTQRNVASVVRNGQGDYRITFSTPMQNASYVMSAAVSYNPAQVSNCNIKGSPTAEYVDVMCLAVNAAIGGTFDPAQVHLTFFEAED